MEEENRTSVDPDDLLAGYVDVVDSSQRRSSPFASPEGTLLRPVQEGVRVVSPASVTATRDQESIPQAHAEDSFPSPRRRGTPTAVAAANRRRNRHQVTYEDLVSRPRSNPRARTPMRYESPLEHGAFSRDAAARREESPPTIAIRAGLGVGVVRAMPERTHFDDTAQRPRPITLKSSKQGPSQRKTRRWNNDNFANTAHELANSSSARARAAAEILAQAKADARHFLPVYDPTEKKRSAHVTRFMEDERYSGVRDKFFAGELHAHNAPSNNNNKSQKQSDVDQNNPTPAELYRRIDSRLQRVVAKACANSAPACKVVESFEHYLVGVFDGNDDKNNNSNNTEMPDCDFWKDILLEQPSLAHATDKASRTVTFIFDGDSSSGGFHRLLVHAVTHFHCLKARTSTRDNDDGRVLVVHGVMRGGQYRLLDHLASLQEQKHPHQSC